MPPERACNLRKDCKPECSYPTNSEVPTCYWVSTDPRPREVIEHEQSDCGPGDPGPWTATFSATFSRELHLSRDRGIGIRGGSLCACALANQLIPSIAAPGTAGVPTILAKSLVRGRRVLSGKYLLLCAGMTIRCRTWGPLVFPDRSRSHPTPNLPLRRSTAKTRSREMSDERARITFPFVDVLQRNIPAERRAQAVTKDRS